MDGETVIPKLLMNSSDAVKALDGQQLAYANQPNFPVPEAGIIQSFLGFFDNLGGLVGVIQYIYILDCRIKR